MVTYAPVEAAAARQDVFFIAAAVSATQSAAQQVAFPRYVVSPCLSPTRVPPATRLHGHLVCPTRAIFRPTWWLPVCPVGIYAFIYQSDRGVVGQDRSCDCKVGHLALPRVDHEVDRWHA